MNNFKIKILKLLLIAVLSPFWLFSERGIKNSFNLSNKYSDDNMNSKSTQKNLKSFEMNKYLTTSSYYNFAIGYNIIKDSSFSKLVISELTGKDIYEITLGKVNKGYYYYNWNRITNEGEEVEGGIYFLSIYEDMELISKKNLVIFNILDQKIL